MPVTDTELSIIIQYIDNELTDEEEQQLMARMAVNPALQAAFDQQILMNNFLEADKSSKVTGPSVESADEFLDRINQQQDTGASPKIILMPTAERRWQIIAAAAVAAIAIMVTIYFFRQPKEKTPSIVKIPEKKMTPVIKDSTILNQDTTRLLADNESTYKLFKTNYKALPPQVLVVPAIASPYQMQYEQGRYRELAIASENSLVVKGQLPATEQQKVLGYFRFYKALANLQTGNIPLAVQLLSSVNVIADNKKLADQSEWYLLMAYLRKGDKINALQVAGTIANNINSSYYTKASVIKQELSR